jgi:prepilin-type N-terminal cleavage/methylation domain-containing protein
MLKIVSRFRNQFWRGEKGFTLIELLIAVGVIAVLAAVVIPLATRYVSSGQKGAAMQEMNTVQTAVDGAMNEYGMASTTPLTVGPGDPAAAPLWTVTDGTNSNDVEDFLRRYVDGAWAIGNDGTVTGGKFKSAATSGFWTYDATVSPPTWTWTP